MDRLPITQLLKNNKVAMHKGLTSNLYVFDEPSSGDFELEIYDTADILFTNISKESNYILNINDSAHVHIAFLGNAEIKSGSIIINVKNNVELSIDFADFLFGENYLKVVINLNGENSSCLWHLASLASKQDKKEFDVSIYHNAIKTSATADNYGVCKDNAKLVFSGISKIEKKCIKSITHQNAKIMVFDPDSKAIAKPILKIDENDIQASHAAVVGKINDEHLFYLESRGLSESEAKELITLGYLKPILNRFQDEEYKEKIMKLIEERM